MDDKAKGSEPNLEKYREYLRLLIQLQVDPALHAKIDLSGVVQQTMLEAYRDFRENDRGNTDYETAWLRRILANNLTDEIRKLRTAKRDVSRERSLEADLDQSSKRLQDWIAADQPSPSANALRQEQALQLSEALMELPESQREALMLRHFHNWSLAQIAEHLERSHAAVAGLLKRGLQQLRHRMPEE